MSWSHRFRALTAEAVKQGAAVLTPSVPADGQIGRLLRRFTDQPPPPRRSPLQVFEPRAKRADAATPRGEVVSTRAGGAERGGAFAALAATVPLDALSAAREVDIGALLAERYVIHRIAGQGPAFRVYAARHRAWDLDVALKMPFGAAALDLAGAALRWTGLGLHPHVVYCHYLDRCEALPLLVVEYRAGGSLRPWINSGRTANLRLGIALALQLCHGLERAHAEGVWHGGLRPENALFDAHGTLAIADFGLAAAALLCRPDGEVLAPARRLELEPYVAPEQWVDPAAIDARTDLFALGVCLYEMFAGGRPYEVARGPRREPPDPSAGGVALPARLATLLRRLVDWEPGNRPVCAREVRAELAALHRDLYRRPSAFEALPERSWDADGWNNQAVALTVLGHAADADAAWSNALAADPCHLEAAYNSGLTRWNRAEVSDAVALDAVARAAAANPHEARAAVLLADTQLRCGDAAAAVAGLEAVGEAALGAAELALLARARQQASSGAGLVSTHVGCRGYVASVQLIDGGQRLLAAGDDGTLGVWAAGEAAPLRVLDGHRGGVAAVAVGSDGRVAVSGGEDATLRVWELRSGRCLKTIATPGKVFALAVSADLARAVFACSGSDNFVGVDSTVLLAWDLEHDRPLAQLVGHTSAAKCIALSADGHFAASGGDDHTVRIWDIAQGGGCRRVLQGHEHYVSAVCLSADGGIAVSGGWDTTLRVWDTHSGRCLHLLSGHDGIVNALALSADGRLLVSGGWDRTMRVWEVASGRCLRTFTAHDGIVASVAVSADGSVAASGSWDKTARLWRLPRSVDTGFTPRLSRRPPAPPLPSGEPEPDELLDDADAALRAERFAAALAAVRVARERAAGADARRAAALWAQLAARCRRSGVRGLLPHASWAARHALSAAVPLAAGRWVLEATRAGALRVFDPELERVARACEGHTARVHAVALSADEQVAVSAAADRTLRVWDLATGRCARVLAGHSSVVAAVDLDAAGGAVLSGGYDHAVRLWDLAGGGGRVLGAHPRQVTAVAFVAPGRAASGDYAGGVRLWALADGSASLLPAGHTAAVTVLRAGADGAWLLSAGADGTLRLWSVEHGTCAAVCEGRGGTVLAADLAPDASWALAVAADGTATVWDLHTARAANSVRVADGPIAAAAVRFAAGCVSAIDLAGRVHLWAIDWELAAPGEGTER